MAPPRPPADTFLAWSAPRRIGAAAALIALLWLAVLWALGA